MTAILRLILTRSLMSPMARKSHYDITRCNLATTQRNKQVSGQVNTQVACPKLRFMKDCVTLRDSSDTYGRIARRFGKNVQFAVESTCTERHRLRNLSCIARATTGSRAMRSNTAATSATDSSARSASSSMR